ncbi:MAG: DUF971 domain-containing protein [Magnetococcales bacterium]|nr:DUF971 domain-containing protein [Magnetococcales bacterium]
MNDQSYDFQHIPTEIRQVTKDRKLILTFDNGESFEMTMEYLRVMCPCAECRGHTPDQRQLIHGKKNVTITEISPIGHYAIKIVFNDGHSGGVYSWETLYDLGNLQEPYWNKYLQELKEAGKHRMSWEIKAM